MLRWRFRLFQRHRHNRLVIEEIAGHSIIVLPQVLNPKLFRTGEFLAETLNQELIPPGAIVLDMGTGSGVCAVVAAQTAERVLAVDINPEAVRCARMNALLHRVDGRVQFVEGDLFAPVQGQQFDRILFNPPYLRGAPHDLFERALWSTDVIERFVTDLRSYLTPGGYALVLLSSIAEVEHFYKLTQVQGLEVAVVATRDLLAETLIIYRLS